jgi:polyhydroxyalkanoate synthesis regulator phasin
MGWPQPPPPSNAYYSSAQPPEMESLRREKEDLTNKLNYRSQEVDRLNAEVSTLKGQVRELQQHTAVCK